MHMYVCAHVHVCTIPSDAKARQHNRKIKEHNTTHQNSYFQRKLGCLGWDSNPQHLHSVYTYGANMYRYYGRKCLSHLLTAADFEKVSSRTLNSQQWAKMKDAVETLRTKVHVHVYCMYHTLCLPAFTQQYTWMRRRLEYVCVITAYLSVMNFNRDTC